MDTSVVISALRSKRGASNVLMTMVAERKLTMIASSPLLLEYEEVMLRAEHRLIHGLSMEQVDRFMRALALLVEPVEIRFQWRPQVLDPNDEMVFEAAVNGRADALVTHNVRHFLAAAGRFQLRVLTPKEALKELQDE